MNDNEIKLIELPKIKDKRGNLSFLEDNHQIPFKIKRAYWIYDVPGGEERGGHAFKNCNELIIPLSGTFTVDIIRGSLEETYHLKRTNIGLYIPQNTYRKIYDFVANSVCLIVADTYFEECEYVYDLDVYKNSFQKNLDE